MQILALACLAALAVPAAAAAGGRASAASTDATIHQLEWLAGSWAGTHGKATIEEHWTAPLGGSMLAVARTVRGDRLQTFEFLRIVEQEGTLLYIAAPEGRSPATTFTLTRIEPRSVTFENPAHDFPTVIRYAVGADGVLEATISGAKHEHAQVFRFRRK